MSTDNQNKPQWQQRFRDIMFGDLRVIKFILDERPESWGDRFVPISKWGAILEDFMNRHEHEMTRKEMETFFAQVQTLATRVRKADEFREQWQS